MANPSRDTLRDRVAKAQQALQEAEDRLSAKRDRAVRTHDRVAELRRLRILHRGEPGTPTAVQVQEAVTERDAAMAELDAVETELGVVDAPAG